MKMASNRARHAEPASMRDRARHYVLRKIASGEFSAGSALSEVAIAKDLGSSRTPVREAIGQLVAEGLIEQIPNRGAVVVELTRQDIIDLYELREALEIYAARKAASQSSQQDAQRLQTFADDILSLKEALVQSGKKALDSAQMQRFVNADLSFHTLLMRAAGNRRLLKVVNDTRVLIRIFLSMRRHGHSVEDLERIHKQHSDVLRAVADGDADRATRLVSDHIRTSLQERLDEYDHWERETSMRDSLQAFFEQPVE
jgi:DNA-binding GntR family transcriptional regulator